MTAIAFCQGTIAIDRQSTMDFGLRSEVTKYSIRREVANGAETLYTAVGNGLICRTWIQEQDLIQICKIPQCIKEHAVSGKSSTLLSFCGNNAYEHVYDPARDAMLRFKLEGDVLGFGLANEIAQAVALMWPSHIDPEGIPERAIKICCRIHSGCGVGIDVLTFSENRQTWDLRDDPGLVPSSGMFVLPDDWRKF